MYVVEHALLNLGKNKGRNILIAIILVAVITSAFVGVAIYNASDAIIRQARIDFEAMVRIRPQRRQPVSAGTGGASADASTAGANTDASTSGSGNIQELTIEDFYNFADSRYLAGAQIAPGIGIGRGTGVVATFHLISPDLLPAFEAEMREKGLPDDWIVYRDELAYRRMLAPIESLQDVATTFLVIVLIFGAAIMILLSVIAIRERKYEIGVLRAMGMKKKKIALCLWVETVAVTCLCSIIGMIAGMALAQPVSNMLWAGEGTIRIAFGAITVLQILGIAVVLASLAGAVSVSRITKYEPIKILMNRD